MTLPVRDNGRHSYADVLRWPEDQRYELIDGVAYAMSPAPSRVHQGMVGELFRQIADALEGSSCKAYVAPFDVRMPAGGEPDGEIDTVVQPDVLVVCDPTKLDERGCRGAPDWVIEVLSPHTAGHDQVAKLAVYERHGVPEYWLVHPVDRVVTVYRRGSEGSEYGRPSVHLLEETLAAKSVDVVIDWARIVAAL